MNIIRAGQPHPIKLLTGAICVALMLLFVVLSYSAARTKSATVDEPLHLVAGFVHRDAGDFRMDPEDPSLFGFLATLPLGSSALTPDYQLRNWSAILEDHNLHQWDFATDVLRTTPGIDVDAMFQRSRAVFVLVGITLGALIITWSWQMGGAIGCLVATALFTLDPNFLGHSGVIKNDVLFTTTFTLLGACAWRFGHRGTAGSLAGLAVACAIAINVKFSGVIAAPLAGLLLIVRALLPAPWVVMRWNLETRLQRLIVAPIAVVVIGIITYATIWACYGFRFPPTQEPQTTLNTEQVLLRIKASRASERLHQDAITVEVAQAEPAGFIPSLLEWTEKRRLLPQAFVYGFLFTYNTTLHFLPAYLMGKYSQVGWWYYFPCAIVFKTPTATLLAGVVAIVAAAVLMIRRDRTRASSAWQVDWWSIFCLGVPAFIYGLISLSTRLNVGVRHILPVYPFAFIAIGAIFGRLVQRHPRIGAICAVVLLLGLSIESLAAYPNYIAFFNAPSGGSRGGIKLLGDSNLDWGQDLKLLAQWQQTHQQKPLYLVYFGSIDPAYYGVQATYLPGGWPYTSRTPLRANTAGYLAISATHLLGILYKPEDRQMYAALRRFNPIAVLGGSIYVYELPLRDQDRVGE